MLFIFAAASAYGGYLEGVPQEEKPVQVIESFVENDAELYVHYLDVGQGDCSLIVYDGKTVLIDGGEKEYSGYVADYISSLGISRIDYLIATHPHSDHIGSLPHIISTFDVGTVLVPKINEELTPTSIIYEDFLDALSEKCIRMTAAKAGDVYTISDDTEENKDSVRLEIISPVYEEYSDLNNWSVVVRLVYGNSSFLFTGDAEAEAENGILESGADISADVLKVGHHGSASSTSEEFLAAVDPDIAVIQYQKDNEYGHPHKDVTNRLENYGLIIYGTAVNGTIVACSDGEDIYILDDKSLTEENLQAA